MYTDMHTDMSLYIERERDTHTHTHIDKPLPIFCFLKQSYNFSHLRKRPISLKKSLCTDKDRDNPLNEDTNIDTSQDTDTHT